MARHQRRNMSIRDHRLTQNRGLIIVHHAGMDIHQAIFGSGLLAQAHPRFDDVYDRIRPAGRRTRRYQPAGAA